MVLRKIPRRYRYFIHRPSLLKIKFGNLPLVALHLKLIKSVFIKTGDSFQFRPYPSPFINQKTTKAMKTEKQRTLERTDCDDFPSPISQVPFWERMYAVSMTKDDHFENRPFANLTFHIKEGANSAIVHE